MSELSFPRIIYHEKLGARTDYGYGYKKVDSPGEFDKHIAQGWYENSTDVPTNIFVKREPLPEGEPGDPVELEPVAAPAKGRPGRPRKKA